MHKNPVAGKWKLAEHYLDYKHPSAGFYNLGEKAACTFYNYAEVESEVKSAESPRQNSSLL